MARRKVLKGAHCVRMKRTKHGKRCAKFAGGGLGAARRGKKHGKCIRFKRTSGGKRCAKFR